MLQQLPGARIVQTRWIDTNKADDSLEADIRSRCVAKEFATKPLDDIFAATPALEGVKTLVSLMSSSNEGRAPTQ